jgi:hypothetical protein
MYIPVSTSAFIFSNITKIINKKNMNDNNTNNNNDNIYLSILFFIISICAFITWILYTIHTTKIKNF